MGIQNLSWELGSFTNIAEIPVAPGVEHFVLDTSLDEVYFALQLLERNRQLSLANRIEDWTSLGQYNWKPEFDIVTRESSSSSSAVSCPISFEANFVPLNNSDQEEILEIHYSL